jgi:hypothetical protein
VSLPDLDVFFPKGHQFRSSESASEQDGDHGHVTGGTEAFAIGFLKKQSGLITGYRRPQGSVLANHAIFIR